MEILLRHSYFENILTTFVCSYTLVSSQGREYKKSILRLAINDSTNETKPSTRKGQ